MKLPWLKSVFENDGPFTAVHLDTTRTDPNAAYELEARWGHMRSELAKEGAPEDLLAEIEDSVLSPSLIGGRHGRTILADDSGILVDRVLPAPPLQESAHRSEDPRLLELVQLTPYAVSQLLIVVDRAGADLHLRAPENPSISHGPNGLGEDATVEGGHDVLHKANLGRGTPYGWRANNYEARVEDSWERNAEAVAGTVDRLVREHSPDMVLLTGDVRAMALLKDALGHEAREQVREVSGGTRGVALDRGSFREVLSRVTREFIDERQQQLSDRFHESQARDGASVGGAVEVAQALERGQVEELIFISGREPASIERMLRGAILTDAGISALEAEFDGVPEGIGALLRWRDEATPSNQVGSMSGDARREDAVDPARDEPSPHVQEEARLRG